LTNPRIVEPCVLFKTAEMVRTLAGVKPFEFAVCDSYIAAQSLAWSAHGFSRSGGPAHRQSIVVVGEDRGLSPVLPEPTATLTGVLAGRAGFAHQQHKGRLAVTGEVIGETRPAKWPVWGASARPSYTKTGPRRQRAPHRMPNLVPMNTTSVRLNEACIPSGRVQVYGDLALKTRGYATILALMAACSCACSQEAPSSVPADPGALQAPPAIDPEIAKRPPTNIDPQAIERPPSNVDPQMAKKPPIESAGRLEGKEAVPEKRSREDDCKGPADLCKQDSAR
jgi:hypothetical protein